MKKLIYLIIMIALCSLALAKEGAFTIFLTTDGGNVKLESVDRYWIEPPYYISDEYDNMVARVMSFNGTEIYSWTYSTDLTSYVDDIRIDELPLDFSFRDYREAKEVVVFDRIINRTVLVIDLTPYQSCNFDYFCDMNEDKESCPEDCDLIYALGGDRQMEPSEEAAQEIAQVSEQTPPEKQDTKGLYILIIVVLLLASVAFLMFMLSRKRKA